MNKTALKNFAVAARLEMLQRVMNRAERLQLLEESTLLSRYEDSRRGYTFAAGITDSHFHLTKLWGGPALWERASERVYSFPLEGDIPMMLLFVKLWIMVGVGKIVGHH